MTRKYAAALILLVAQACVVRASWAEPSMDPPRYDSTSYCMRLARTENGISDEAQAQCLAQQRMAYDAVRKIWDELPEITQDGCDAYTRAVHPHDYVTLSTCIESQRRRVPPEPDKEPEPEQEPAPASQPALQ